MFYLIWWLYFVQRPQRFRLAMGQYIAPVLLLLILTIDAFNCSGQILGPFEASLKEIVRCEDSGTEDINFSSTRLSRVSRSSVNYFTNYTLKIPFDDNLSAVIDWQAWGNGGWRPGFFTLDCPQLCTSIRDLNPNWFREILKNVGRDDCPVPPGTYLMKLYNVSYVDFKVPMFPYGKYRIISQMFKDSVVVGCSGIVAEFTPKKKNLSQKIP